MVYGVGNTRECVGQSDELQSTVRVVIEAEFQGMTEDGSEMVDGVAQKEK